MIITIDGPVASGKSSAARLLAQKLEFYYLNSGLLYRALGYLLLEKGGYSLEKLATVSNHDVDTYLDAQRLFYDEDEQGLPQIMFDQNDITPFLKSELIDKAASIVSTNPYVRETLLVWQRQLAAHHNVVAEGRDSGTVVFPAAEVKFFLTAASEVRAQRWQADQEKRGEMVSYDEAKEQIAERDSRDSQRAIAPLVVPAGAITIDNSAMTLQETVSQMIQAVYKLA